MPTSAESGFRVLVVDDEPKILRSLENLLGDDFAVIASLDPQRALELLADTRVDVILSDQRMPGMTGDRFLSQARELSEAPRILITGYADLNALIQAVNDGQIYAYVPKPWDPGQLRGTIRRAADHFRLEQSLRREQDLLRRVLETSPAGVLLLDQAGHLLFANPRAQALLDLDAGGPASMSSGAADEGLETPPRSLAVHEPQSFRGEPIAQTPWDEVLASGTPVSARELSIRNRGGQRTFLMCNAAPLPGPNGQFEGVVVALEDVGGRLQLERALRQAQKTEAIGRLAGGIAHDFNNLLTGIGGFVTLARDVGPASLSYREDLDQALRLVGRASELTGQLLAFNRRQSLTVGVIDLDELVRNGLLMLRRLLGADVRLSFEPTRGHSTVRVDPGQLEQVLVNLAVNARDAMPEGGDLMIAIATLNVGPEDVVATEDGQLATGEWIELTVRDTGTGMDEETRQRAFDPFFTTKEVGKGTGLGLPTVRGIVLQHGGAIVLETRPGAGTTFRVYLPYDQTRTAIEPVAAPPELPSVGSEVILVCEDEPPLRRLIARILEAQGYRAIVTQRPSEALARFADDPGAIDLLLTDLRLPELNGEVLYRRLAERAPELRVLVISGYADQQLLDSNLPFLHKPFSPSDLARRIREVLDADPPGNDGDGEETS